MSAVKRNTTLDVIKLFAAYMVVFIHHRFYGNFGTVVDALARFAVPLFFISSGYFCYNNSVDKIKKKLLHIVKLFVFATLLYHAVNIILQLITGGVLELKAYFMECFEIKSIAKVLFFNEPASSQHLWFLLALIYVYAVQIFVVRFKVPEKIMFTLSVGALVLHILLGEGLSAFGITVPIVLVRNFLFFGYPFFALGMMLRKHSERVSGINNGILLLLMAIGVVESVVSSFAFGKNELYFGTILIVLSIVIFALKYPNLKILGSLTAYSTYIYIFHQMVGKLINLALSFAGIDSSTILISNIKPILICVLTTALAYVVVAIENKFKSKRA